MDDFVEALVLKDETITSYNENWTWSQLKEREEHGCDPRLTPHKYKIQDFHDGVCQLQAVVTQPKDYNGIREPMAYSMVTITLGYINYVLASKIISLPDLRRIVFLPPAHRSQFRRQEHHILSSIVEFLKHFNSLHSIVLPLDLKEKSMVVLAALRHHGRLVNLELALPSTFTIDINGPRSLLESALCQGIEGFHSLQKIILPCELLSVDLFFYLGLLHNLKVLKVKPLAGSTGGDRFIDFVRAHNISSANSFYALRQLDIDVAHTDPSKLSSRGLTKYFHGIEYL